MKGVLTYKTKPFPGYKLDMPWYDEMIGVSRKKLQEAQESRRELMVIDNRKKTIGVQYMVFRGYEVPEGIGEFPDKFGRDEKYFLFYFKWDPQQQLTLL